MPENTEKSNIFDPQSQRDNIAFSPDELVECTGCQRKNPPNRLNCFYCGNPLDIKAESASSLKSNFRKLELWERGFNLIFLRSTNASTPQMKNIASLLSAEAGEISSILNAQTPLPLARIESEEEACILETGLNRLGMECSIVSDADLDADKLPVRLSKIEIKDDHLALTDFNTANVTTVAFDELALIIPGVIGSSKLDSTAKKGLRGKVKILDETAASKSEAVLDLYRRRDPVGFRVHLTGFDFSCLGSKKGMIAGENLLKLAEVLRSHSPNARHIVNYNAVRNLIGNVWEIDSRKDAMGLKQVAIGQRGFATIESSSNMQQFTKYSRLQWHLL